MIEHDDFYDDEEYPVDRFESMLKTNRIFFYDTDDFEFIICHYLGIGKISLAKKAVKMGLDQHPDSFAIKLLKVEVLLFDDKLGQADAILNELIELEPSNPDIYVHKADILSKQDHHREAIALLETASNLVDQDAEIFSTIAFEYMILEDYEQAKYHFMKCLEIDVEDSGALFNITYCFDYLGQTDEAIDFLNIFLDKMPYSEVAWHQMGLQYVTLKDYEKALACFDFAIISDDYFVGAYMEKGKVLEKLKRYPEAIESYQIAIELESPSAFAYFHIARCYERLQDAEATLNYYKKALKTDPLLEKAWLAITAFCVRQKDYRQALHYIEEAIAQDNENAAYWKRYAEINQRLNLLDSAERCLQKSLEFGNYELEIWIERSDLLTKTARFETALQVLKQAQQFYPHAAEIEYRLAGLYLSTNKRTTGLSHLKKALHIDAEYVLIIEELFPKVFQRKSIQRLIAKSGYME